MPCPNRYFCLPQQQKITNLLSDGMFLFRFPNSRALTMDSDEDARLPAIPVASLIETDKAVFDEVHRFLTSVANSSNPKQTSQAASIQLESIFNNQNRTRLDSVGSRPSRDHYFESWPPKSKVQLEAIVRITGRPSLLVQYGNWQEPVIKEIKNRLRRNRLKLQPLLPSIGRVEKTVNGVTTMIGTGWIIDRNILVTNRHVAKDFANNTISGSFELALPENAVTTDFKREYKNTDTLKVGITKILKIVAEQSNDIAFLKVEKRDSPLPEPLQMKDCPPEFGQHVICVGYPAEDPRNDFFAMLKYFDNIYEVKRLSPGQLTGVEHQSWIQHDCTTLGGSSGSAVIDLESGEVVGLHFSGSYKKRNLAVKVAILKNELAKL